MEADGAVDGAIVPGIQPGGLLDTLNAVANLTIDAITTNTTNETALATPDTRVQEPALNLSLSLDPHADIYQYAYQEAWNQYKTQCFDIYNEDMALTDSESDARLTQVQCFAGMLNLTDAPSIYNFTNFTGYYQSIGCMLSNVTYEDRFRFPGVYHFCSVPGEAPDVFLFAALALLAACFLFGKLSTVWVLIAGCLLATLNFFVNLLEIGNSIALWLDIQPPDLFLYAFLPPLIVEQAIRIDFYLFKKNFFRSLMLAVVMVIMTTVILTPIILYVLGFNGDGWTWVFAGLFSAVIAPTDALAVASVLKKSNGPAVLTNLLESESLLNDATGITLFQIFFDVIRDSRIPSNAPSVWSVIPTIIKDIVVLTAIGFGVGLAFSMVALYALKWLRWRGAGNYIEATFVLAMSYLVYWVTQSPCGGSGVIGVVTFGLFGNATLQWGMTGSAFKSGDFEAMWDMISFLANGLVFFWAGIASMSFLIPACIELPKSALAYASVVLIYLFMLIIRTGCVALFNPIFHLMKCRMSAAEILFVGWCGLRGAVSLILLATLSSGSREYVRYPEEKEQGVEGGRGSDIVNVKSDIALWTTTFIILTLVVNGPLIAPLMKSFGLTKISRAASKVQARAKEKILEYTEASILKYQDDDSAFLTGADWLSVSKYVDLEPALRKFGRVKARKRSASGRMSFGGYVDPTSYLSVLKAFVVTCWRWTKGLVLDVVLLRFRCRDSDDFYETGSVYDDDGEEKEGRDRDAGGDGSEYDGDGSRGSEGSGQGRNGYGAGRGNDGNPPGVDFEVRGGDDESASRHRQREISSDDGSVYGEGAFENECHFQPIERTLTRLASTSTWDLEHGLSSIHVSSPTGTDLSRTSIDSVAKSNEDSYHGPTLEDANQICLSGIAGKMLMKELMASQDAEIPGDSDEEAETPRSLKYYSSLPASTAAGLYNELKENLERTRSSMVTPLTEREGGQGPAGHATPSTVTTNKPEVSRPTIQDLSTIFSGVEDSGHASDHATQATVSPFTALAPLGTSVGASQQSPTQSVAGDPDSPGAIYPIHSYTVSGASAVQLQKELAQAGSFRHIRIFDGGQIDGRNTRDLLGNKQASAPNPGEPPLAMHPLAMRSFSRGAGDISRHLALRSNLHQLKQESLAGSSSDKLGKSGSTSGRADGTNESTIPEEMPEKFSDLARDPRSGEHVDESYDAEHGDEHEDNMAEIRSRMIAGLKQSFTKRRAEGKISLEAFQILDQTCQENIDSPGKLQLWSTLERTSQGGWFIKLTYNAAFAVGKWYKQQRPWIRKLLHYPWEGSMLLFRKYVGRAVLISCEVAIEYTLALAVSQHVRWLKLHDEYFSTLLDEVNEEVEKSHSFIIDREIEAPDTFRAIQSYRAAIIVLKDMQAYVETLVEAGILSSTEAEMINGHIDDKLRKLELTGPVWRPAKFSDTMKSLRPFIGLDPKTLDWLWNMGLFQEYMPGQPFFMEDTPDAATDSGIFHVLSGVAKKLVYSKDDGKLLKEEYLGVGSCFGVRRALGLATGRRATVVYATGNALGRGTVVFRLMQSDVDRILALSKGGSPIMHEIITRWTKIAALNVLDGSWEALAAKIEVLLSHNATGGGGGHEDTGHHEHDSNHPQKHGHVGRAVSLCDVLSDETFDIHRNADTVPISQKVIHARALAMAKEITARLRRGFLSSEVRHLLRGDTLRQSTTIVLLKGTVEVQEEGGTQAPVEAPAILPHLTKEENESLTRSFAEEVEAKGLPLEQDAVWRVSSMTALALIFPE